MATQNSHDGVHRLILSKQISLFDWLHKMAVQNGYTRGYTKGYTESLSNGYKKLALQNCYIEWLPTIIRVPYSDCRNKINVINKKNAFKSLSFENT